MLKVISSSNRLMISFLWSCGELCPSGNKKVARSARIYASHSVGTDSSRSVAVRRRVDLSTAEMSTMSSSRRPGTCRTNEAFSKASWCCLSAFQSRKSRFWYLLVTLNTATSKRDVDGCDVGCVVGEVEGCEVGDDDGQVGFEEG